MEKMAFAIIIVLFVIWIAASGRLMTYINLARGQKKESSVTPVSDDFFSNMMKQFQK